MRTRRFKTTIKVKAKRRGARRRETRSSPRNTENRTHALRSSLPALLKIPPFALLQHKTPAFQKNQRSFFIDFSVRSCARARLCHPPPPLRNRSLTSPIPPNSAAHEGGGRDASLSDTLQFQPKNCPSHSRPRTFASSQNAPHASTRSRECASFPRAVQQRRGAGASHTQYFERWKNGRASHLKRRAKYVRACKIPSNARGQKAITHETGKKAIASRKYLPTPTTTHVDAIMRTLARCLPRRRNDPTKSANKPMDTKCRG